MNLTLKRATAAVASPLIDLVLLPVIALAAPALRLFRRIGAERLPLSRRLLRLLGIWPLRRHYYDPLFDPADLSGPLNAPRVLAGIDWNVPEQLAILARMRYGDELREFARPAPPGERRFSLANVTFLSGDADYLYSFVRLFKPGRIIEVGCGSSTLAILAANRANRAADSRHACEHVCVEPYEQPWLESLGVRVVRERVERLDPRLFRELSAGDLLFIDSSHVIRPCGDVIFEILEVLPQLQSGVFVHFHDIFSPRNYLPDWLEQRAYLWNEQYLLEAFLCHNSAFKVTGALNFLHHHHYHELAAICGGHAPHFEPGSFYVQRR